MKEEEVEEKARLKRRRRGRRRPGVDSAIVDCAVQGESKLQLR